MDDSKLQLFRQKAISAGYDPTDVEKFIQAKQEQTAARALVQQGVGDVESLAEEDPVGALNILKEQEASGKTPGQSPLLKSIISGKIALKDLTPSERTKVLKESANLGVEIPESTELTTDQKKRQAIINQAVPIISRITEAAEKAPAGVEGSAKALLGKLPGVSGGEAEYLARDTEGFAKLIASAFAGEVGVATDRDVNRWLKLMPRPGDTLEERRRQSRELVKQIELESKGLGVEVPEALKDVTKNIPEGQTTKQGGPSVLEKFFPNISSYAKGAISAPGEIRNLAGEGREQEARQLAKEYSMSPTSVLSNTKIGKAQREALQDMAMAAFFPRLFGKGKEVVRPIKTAGAKRLSAAAELEQTGGEIASKGLQKVSKELVKSRVATYTEKPLLRKLMQGKGIKPTEAVKLMSSAGKKAFTKSGDPRITKASDLYSLLRGELRTQFESKAPEVIKQTSKIAKAKGVQKLASRAVYPAAIAGGVGAGMSALSRLLGVQNR